MLQIKRFGWKRDLPDFRDQMFESPIFVETLPRSVDLRPLCPPIYDQGDLGSCTANAIGGAMEFLQMKQAQPKIFVPSRLFIYYDERVREHSVNDDSGAMIRDGVKSVATIGAPPEDLWPYDITKFVLKPSPEAYQEALNHQILSYKRISQQISQIKGCLAAGFPFVFGFTCYESLMSAPVAQSGDVPMPGLSESVIGGHAVLAVGYDESLKVIRFRNSWGAGWGDAGYGTIPYQYLLHSGLAADFWTLRLSE